MGSQLFKIVLYYIVSLFISKTWLTKCSHLQDKWTKCPYLGN